MRRVQTCCVVILLTVVFKIDNLVADTHDAEEFAPSEGFHPLWGISRQCYKCSYQEHGDDCLNANPNSLVAYSSDCNHDEGHLDLHVCMMFIPKDPRVAGQPWHFRRDCTTRKIAELNDPPDTDPTVVPEYRWNWKAEKGYLTHFETNDCGPEDVTAVERCSQAERDNHHLGTAFICQTPKCNGVALFDVPYKKDFNKTGKEPDVWYFMYTQYNKTTPKPAATFATAKRKPKTTTTTTTTTTTKSTPTTTTTATTTPTTTTTTTTPTTTTTTTPTTTTTTTPTTTTTTTPTTTTTTTTTTPTTTTTTTKAPKVTQPPTEVTTSAAICGHIHFWAYFASVIMVVYCGGCIDLG